MINRVFSFMVGSRNGFFFIHICLSQFSVSNGKGILEFLFKIFLPAVDIMKLMSSDCYESNSIICFLTPVDSLKKIAVKAEVFTD